MKRAAIFALCLFCGGCAKRPARVTIPIACMKIRVVDFTRPCEIVKGTDYMMCDRVKVKVNCVAVAK